MKKKLSESQYRLLLCLIMVAIFSVSYQFGYTRLEDHADSYRVKAESVKAEIEQRNKEIAQEETLKTETKDMTGECDKIISKYPVNIMKEDDLIFIEDMKKKLNIDIPAANISIADNVVFYNTILPIRDKDGKEIIVTGNSAQTSDSTGNIAAATPVATDTSSTAAVTSTAVNQPAASAATPTGGAAASLSDPSGQRYMTGLQSQITISFTATNEKFLKVVNYIDNYPVTTSISDASLNYDSSTGDLIAKMTISRYALTGTGKVYEEPDLGDISIGTKDLFGTESTKKKSAK